MGRGDCRWLPSMCTSTFFVDPFSYSHTCAHIVGPRKRIYVFIITHIVCLECNTIVDRPRGRPAVD
jgi:hypothetical protein